MLLFIFQGAFSGAWLAFIGWFLLLAAGAERRYAQARRALGGLRVRDVMVRDPISVRPDMTLGEFMDEVVWARRYTSYPVVEHGQAAGLLPFRCVAEVPRSEWDVRLVRDCMLPLGRVPTFREDEPAAAAIARLAASPLSRGLVLENGHLVGLLSITDLARRLTIER